MTSLSQVFTASFSSYRAGKNIQKDLERAQLAINIMAKSLRTSSVVSSDGDSESKIRFYDYSQGMCIEYAFQGESLTFAFANVVDVTDCDDSTALSEPQEVASGTIEGSFSVRKSRDEASGSRSLGRVIISVQVSSGTHSARMQSAVSLRDYAYVGI
jgi:hypothetical protein